MNSVQALVAVVTGVFFLTALLTGIWKWRCMMAATDHEAPRYVDIAHRTALMYSFAGLLVWHFVGWSAWPDAINLVGAALLLAFFAMAIATYIRLGIADTTDNQFEQRNFNTTTGMWLLVGAEVGGFLILFSGVLAGLA